MTKVILGRGSRGPLARADIPRCDHGDPICLCGCVCAWVSPHGWACPHCDVPVLYSTASDVARRRALIGMTLGSCDD